MLLLVSTSDVLRLVTSAAEDVDVHASFMDYNGTVVTPDRKNTAISTATTTTIVPSPAGSTQRNVKALYIRAKATNGGPVDVTVEHFDGSIAVELKRVTLNPDDELQFNDELGFLVL